MAAGKAAWLMSEKEYPLKVAPGEYEKPTEHEIRIKQGAAGINPVDMALQLMAIFPLKYPSIIGLDCAGEIVEVGDSVKDFVVGDRVLAMASPFHGFGADLKHATSPHGAFQDYVNVDAKLSCKIPDSTTFAEACVLPLTLCTAACGMFQKHTLNMAHPSVNPKPTGKTLLVWGAASGVGANAVQLGVAAGYEVITTASAKNFDFAKKMGASQVFDYKSDKVVDDIIDACKGKTLVGALDAIGQPEPLEACATILSKTEGGKMIAEARPLTGEEKLPEGIEAKFILGAELRDNDLSDVIFKDFLPKALAEGKYLCAPEPEVVGHGAEHVQAALDAYRDGGINAGEGKKTISAKKLVVTF